MKIRIHLLVVLSSLMFLGMACSVKKDRLLNRGYHAMTTKYNILYNGDLAYEEALAHLQEDYFDDFWEILPVERIAIKVDPTREFERGPSLNSKRGSIADNFSLTGDLQVDSLKGAVGFQRAENKAVKAIQEHSMYIKGLERNWQIDDAYVLLGKSRYFDGRFLPALEAFNFVLYKYPNGSLSNEAKIWREKTNIRLNYEDVAIKNLQEVLKTKKNELPKRLSSEANAMLAQAYINLEQYEEAIKALKAAISFTGNSELRSRYLYILGQLYAKTGQKELGYATFQEILDMNRRAKRTYAMHAYAEQFALDPTPARDSVLFLKKYKKLLANRENRPYLDVLNRQVGLFYEHSGNTSKALEYLKRAVKEGKGDQQLKANNYLSIADIYFNSAGYALSGQYYDSALSLLPERAKDRLRIVRRRQALHDVVKYEMIAKTNDSILRLVAMPIAARTAYFEDYIDKLRTEDFRKLQANLKGKKRDSAIDYFNMADFGQAIEASIQDNATPTLHSNSRFYFNSPQAVEQGKAEFRRKWGNRALVNNWRNIAVSQRDIKESNVDGKERSKRETNTKLVDPRYDVETYLSKIPQDEQQIALIKKDRDFAYFQLGSMYVDRFKKYDLASERLEKLLTFDPAERLILPSMYKLYKIYLETDMAKALAMKARIISEYPDSRYAKLLQNVRLDEINDLSPEQLYTEIYRIYAAEKYSEAYHRINTILERYDNDYISKFELLKAQIIAKLEGLEAYRDALNFVALTYSSSPEGIEANRILEEVLPRLDNKEQKQEAGSDNWKLVLLTDREEEGVRKVLEDFARANQRIGVSFTVDSLGDGKLLYVLHGLRNSDDAERIKDRLNIVGGRVMNGVEFTQRQIKKEWNMIEKD